jgi:hypothetical protein
LVVEVDVAVGGDLGGSVPEERALSVVIARMLDAGPRYNVEWIAE